MPCMTFSDDSSLLCCGFVDGCVRLWSMNNEHEINDERGDSASRDSGMRRNASNTPAYSPLPTCRLIGHSGPVYSLSFDSLKGSSGSPDYLLSASADTSVRLWSLNVSSTLAVFRGHQSPVWDVEWSPLGIYFATASRDCSARLWSVERHTALRIYAGHHSDVNVSVSALGWKIESLVYLVFSVYKNCNIIYMYRS